MAEVRFKEKKFEHAPPGNAPAAGVLGSTAPGQTVYEGLPKDEELDAESAAVAGAGRYDPDAVPEADPKAEPAVEGAPATKTRDKEKRPDLGILA